MPVRADRAGRRPIGRRINRYLYTLEPDRKNRNFRARQRSAVRRAEGARVFRSPGSGYKLLPPRHLG